MEPRGLAEWDPLCEHDDEYLWCNTCSLAAIFQEPAQHCAVSYTRSQRCVTHYPLQLQMQRNFFHPIVSDSAGTGIHPKTEHVALLSERGSSSGECRLHLQEIGIANGMWKDVLFPTICVHSLSLEGSSCTRLASSVLFNLCWPDMLGMQRWCCWYESLLWDEAVLLMGSPHAGASSVAVPHGVGDAEWYSWSFLLLHLSPAVNCYTIPHWLTPNCAHSQFAQRSFALCARYIFLPVFPPAQVCVSWNKQVFLLHSSVLTVTAGTDSTYLGGNAQADHQSVRFHLFLNVHFAFLPLYKGTVWPTLNQITIACEQGYKQK